MKNATRWANFCAGMLMISAMFIVVVYALDRGFGNAATRPLLWIFSILAVASSFAWIRFSYKALEK